MAIAVHGQPGDALGYLYNRGGLNNQKLALFGLFLKASKEEPRRVVLPNLVQFDQISFNHVQVPFETGFRLAPLRDFATRHGIEILDIAPRGDEGGWDYFDRGHNHIPRAALLRDLASDGFACDFFRSLVPVIRDSAHLRRVADAAFGQKGIRLVAQLRIEKDWDFHTAYRLQPVVGQAEDNQLSFRDILAKIRDSLPDRASTIYVVCDEAALPVPKDEIRTAIKRDFDTDLFWKSDFLSDGDMNGLTLLDRSTLDFEMAISADSFVGLTRSTFSCLASFEKHARSGTPVARHYIYNIRGPGLALRVDNGAFAVPELASAADPWRSGQTFNLGRIFEDGGEPHRALAVYIACATSAKPDPEDLFLSLYRAARIKADLDFPAADVIDTYGRASRAMPGRAEAAYGASRYCRAHDLFKQGFDIAAAAIDLPVPADGRFVEAWIYEWALLDEYAVNAFWSGQYGACAEACSRLLAGNRFPEHHRARITANAEAARSKAAKAPAS